MSVVFEIDEDNKQIIALLPLTNPTGYIRIKEMLYTKEGKIVITPIQKIVNTVLEKERRYYVEWQISYFFEESKHHSSAVLEFLEVKTNKGERKGAELALLLFYALKWGWITQETLESLIDFCKQCQKKGCYFLSLFEKYTGILALSLKKYAGILI